MYEQNTSMVAANEQNKFLLPAMVEGDFSRDEIAEDELPAGEDSRRRRPAV